MCVFVCVLSCIKVEDVGLIESTTAVNTTRYHIHVC